LLNRMKLRKALFDQIRSVDDAVINAFASPPQFDLTSGRSAVLGALSIRQALTGLLVDPASVQVAKAISDISTQANTSPIVFAGDPSQEAIAAQLVSAIGQITNAKTTADLDSIIRQSVIAVSRAQQQARDALFSGE